tara:strand:+ start:411 stop:638 length:228 start_codon:yes stop_codon:yes gene_type:complete
MNSLLDCKQCNKEVMVIDIEAQMYVKYAEYYMVKDIDKGSTWETTNPYNKFIVMCESCFEPRLAECKKRVIGSKY